MNLHRSSLLLPLCALALASTPLQTHASTRAMPTPLKGNGIVPEPFKPLHVSLSLTPAKNDAGGPSNLGTFLAELELPQDARAVEPRLSIYRVIDGQEKLVTTVKMDAMARVMGGPGGFDSNWGWLAGLSDKTKFPHGLEPGSYRAEVVVYSQTPPLVGFKTSDPHWIEAGGAAVDFQVGAVNLLPVSEVSGGVSVTATVAPRKGATSAQLALLNKEAVGRVAKVYAGVKTIVAGQASVGRSEPTRKPWLFQEAYARNGLSSSVGVTSGQSFQYLVPQLNSNLSAVVKSGNVAVRLPGGTITLKTTSTISFRK